MSVIASVSAGIQGALLLARGRSEGVQRLDTSQAVAIHSFWAIPLCLPAVICLKLLEWLQSGIPANAPLALGRYLLLFLVGWLLFAWGSHYLASILNKAPRWPLFIAVWSYCSVVENTLIAIGALPGALGAPSLVVQLSELVTIGWALWLEWYGIRLALQVGPLTAMLVLAADIAVGIAMAVLGSGPR